MYEEIAQAIAIAAQAREQSAMFHLQVLLNAAHLEGVKANDFCRLVGVDDNYATEFRKMMKVAELMDRQGIQLTRNQP